MKGHIGLLVGLFALLALVSACQQRAPLSKVPAGKNAAVADQAAGHQEDEHGHTMGLNGGVIVPIGSDSFHAEFVFEDDGNIRMFMLQSDESKVQEIERQSIVAYVTPASQSHWVEIPFEPQPQQGDAPDLTSRFVARLPAELVGKSLRGKITNLKIGADRFRLIFATPQGEEGHAANEMPAKVADDTERELYLSPGGAYTEADIAANGKLTASQKFKGFQAKHDTRPKPGDRICPVTDTKANPQCSWIIQGQQYEFCCPPCVDEFLKLAKTDPAAIKDAQSYVQRE
jgi:predicted small lipoprotein YifL